MHFFGIRSYAEPPLPPSDFTLSSDKTNWNLIDELGFTPSTPIAVTITVEAGVVVRSLAVSIPGMDLSGLPSGSTIALVNNGVIHGRGGRGGHANGGHGVSGGDAIKGPGAGVSLTITNGSGRIYGGGGGGGAGGSASETVETSPGEFTLMTSGGGGGGGGAGGGPAGSGANSTGTGASNGQNGTAGTSGESGVPGSGGNKGVVPSVNAGGDGGDGGDYATAGSAGSPGTNGTTNNSGGNGGSAGKAIELNGGSTPTWVSGNTAARVKGAVS
jgi:hypothetical protein